MSDDPTPTVRTTRLGLELRQIRRERNLTLKKAHEVLKRSVSSLSRIENGQVRLPERDLPPILDGYGITDPRRREALLSLARDAHEKKWWQQYDDVLTTHPDLISLENEATTICAFEGFFVPGLLQTREYAHELFRVAQNGAPSRKLRRLTDVRMRRQRILERAKAPALNAVITESVLRQLVGGVPALGGDIAHVDSSPGPVFFDDAKTTARFSMVFDRLCAAALSETESRELIEQVACAL